MGKRGGVDWTRSISRQHTSHQSDPAKSGILVAEGDTSSSCTQAMPLHTLTTVTLPTELLQALRENKPYGFILLLFLFFFLQELGVDGVAELLLDLQVPRPREAEADRMVAWHWILNL